MINREKVLQKVEPEYSFANNNSKIDSNKQEFTVNESGVFYNDEKISDYLVLSCEIHDISGGNWQLLLKFKDLDGKLKSLRIPANYMATPIEIIKLLYDNGFARVEKQSVFKRYLGKLKSRKRLIEAPNIGWINEDTYICPSFQNITNKYILNNNNDYGYEKKGILEEYKKYIGENCSGNKILVFVQCVALSPILMRFFPEINTTIFHLTGGSSIGKTTALQVAASIWGSPCKFIMQWRATANAQEEIATTHNDSLLILDEISQASDKDIQQIIYMLGNGKGKARLTTDTELKK